MSIKIEQKIVGYDVVKPQPNTATKPAVKQAAGNNHKPHSAIVQMHEKVVRPEMLIGSTYKIKTPVSEHAFYITINDMVLNPKTPYEKRRPFEIFINSKNMDHYQWICALTLIISAVFRKGGDITFLVNELQSVFDPKGGYFKKGGRFIPSLVAAIGDAIEGHLKMIGMIVEAGLDQRQQKLINDKRAEFEGRHSITGAINADNDSGFPEGAVLCNRCSMKAAILMDGCITCLNCGDSKCG